MLIAQPVMQAYEMEQMHDCKSNTSGGKRADVKRADAPLGFVMTISWLTKTVSALGTSSRRQSE